MAEFLTHGWLPVDIELDPQPAIVGEAAVRWLEFGATPLDDPFFTQTVDKLRRMAPPAREIQTNIETMLRLSNRLPAVRPAGFIFHVSHCGSTLLSNALKLAPQTVVASEPHSLVRLTRRFNDPPSPYLKSRWEVRRRMLMDSVLRLMAHYRTGETERIAVKFASLNLMGMKMVRTCWPDTPCVVVVRNPVEVLVRPAAGTGWMAWKTDGELACELFDLNLPPQAVQEMPTEEYCARAMGQLLKSALDAVDEHCKVIDYEDLNRQRICDIASFFGLALPGDEKGLDQVFSYYAKDPERSRPFHSDSARKRRQASRELHQAAQRWAMPAYAALRGKGLW